MRRSVIPGPRLLVTVVVAVFAGCASARPSAYILEEANVVFHARAKALQLGLELVERVAEQVQSLPGDPDMVCRVGTLVDLIDALHGFVAYSLEDLSGEADLPGGVVLVPREGSPAQLEADIRGLMDDTETQMATVPEGLLIASSREALDAMLRAGADAPPPGDAPGAQAFLPNATAGGYVIVPDAITELPFELEFELDTVAFSFGDRTFRYVLGYGDETYARGMAQLMNGPVAVAPNLTERVSRMFPDDLPPDLFTDAMELSELVDYRVLARGGDVIATSRVDPSCLERWLEVVGEMAGLEGFLDGTPPPVSPAL